MDRGMMTLLSNQSQELHSNTSPRTLLMYEGSNSLEKLSLKIWKDKIIYQLKIVYQIRSKLLLDQFVKLIFDLQKMV